MAIFSKRTKEHTVSDIGRAKQKNQAKAKWPGRKKL
jgi:hypothetical protein